MESMLVPPRSPTHIHVAEEAQVPSRQHGIEAASAGLSHFTEGEIHAHGSEPIDGWLGAGKEPVLKDLPPTNETLLPRATSDTVPEATPADAAPQATLADGVDPSSAVSSEDQKQDGGSGPVRRTSSRSRQAPAIFSPLAAEASKRKVAVAGREPDTEAPATKKAKKGPAVKLDGEEEASVVGTEVCRDFISSSMDPEMSISHYDLAVVPPESGPEMKFSLILIRFDSNNIELNSFHSLAGRSR